MLVTNETAERMSGVHASGIDNADITAQVNGNLDTIAANTVGERVLNSAELAATIAIGADLIAMLNGKKEFPQSVIDTVKRVGASLRSGRPILHVLCRILWGHFHTTPGRAEIYGRHAVRRSCDAWP